MPLNKYIFLFLLLSILSACNDTPPAQVENSPVQGNEIKFNKIDAEHSGIFFNNRIQENERLHCFIWNFIYQGAGVGIGDINNDGLPDIFFCGNMVSDKLYLNKGNFRFEDISKTSGIDNRLWSTGVNFVDINSDGLLDIYVCKNFFLLQEGVRKNKLYINNGDLTFTEKAEEYGIADPGFSIQSYFFDAENDGDLDLYLVNQPMDQYAAQLAKPESLARLPFSDKFYRNDNGQFIDITQELGFTNKSYGLSAAIADYDNNGYQDIYLCNDYHHGDKLYMNYGNLEFREEIKSRINHSSFYSMGSDVDDINNDGLFDFITLDMAFNDHVRSKTNMESMRPKRFEELVSEGNHYQYAVNSLQLNCLDGHFKEIAHYAEISHTDWSWTPLLADFDHDGHSDLVISNGILRDLRNNDFVTGMRSSGQFSVGANNYQEVINSIPSTPVSNKVFRNKGMKFEDMTKGSGIEEPGFSSGMAYGDLDGDGDYDLVINNSNSRAGVFENLSQAKPNYIKLKLQGDKKNINAIGSTVHVYFDNKSISKNIQTARGYMSSSTSDITIGLPEETQIDSLIVIWDHRHKSKVIKPQLNSTITISKLQDSKPHRPFSNKQNTGIIQETKLLEYIHTENNYDDYASQVLLPHKLSQNGPGLTVVDLNSDNLEDIIIGGSIGHQPQLFLQNKNGSFTSPSFGNAQMFADMECLNSLVFDADNDGDKDIYFVSGGGQHITSSERNEDLLLTNDNGKFSQSMIELSDSRLDGQSAVSFDFNNDGLTDIMIGGRSVPMAYGQKADTRILINTEKGFIDKTQTYCPELMELGMVTDIIKTDINNDGDIDFIICGEWMPIKLMINKGNEFELQDLNPGGQAPVGWWWKLAAEDFDKDGDMDLIATNIGENNKFHPNFEKTLKLYSGDLDENGDHDVVLAKAYNNRIVPVRGRECSSEEMPFVSEKYTDYSSFAAASLEDIYGQEHLDQSVYLEANSFSHYYFENLGNLNFKALQLPEELQMGCIKDILIYDINKDGFSDFFYAGNHFPVEPETVRYDGGGLGACTYSPEGHFEWVSYNRLGVFHNEDQRDLELISIDGTDYLLLTTNNGALYSFKINGL